MKRILIVDDDTAVLRIMREAIQTLLHWEVDTSPKPEYGFELALKKTYDLMIFDFSMPLIDGTMLFLLISKVYENSSPPRTMPPLAPRLGPGRGRAGAGTAERSPGMRFYSKAFYHQSVNREGESLLPLAGNVEGLAGHSCAA